MTFTFYLYNPVVESFKLLVANLLNIFLSALSLSFFLSASPPLHSFHFMPPLPPCLIYPAIGSEEGYQF